MAETKKFITKDQRLKAFALFSMAADHYAKAREFEDALAELLGYEDSYLGHISDECIDGGNFDSALKKEGFLVVANPKRKPR